MLSFSCVSRNLLQCGATHSPIHIMPTSPSARETGIARNRNCPAYKSLRKSEADLVDARQFSEAACAGDHFRKGEWRRFPAGDWIDAPAVLRMPAKHRHLAKSRMGKARSPECRQRAIHR